MKTLNRQLTSYSQNGRTYKVNARKEVILTAGTINSPQLLLLSGIGPKRHLDTMGIRTIVDLPGVGENLHNHASYGVDFVLNQKAVGELTPDNVHLYFYNQTGPLSSTGLAQLTGILTSNYTTDEDPDIQVFFAGYQAICDTGDRIPDLQSRSENQTVRFTSVNLQTRSRGKRASDCINRVRAADSEIPCRAFRVPIRVKKERPSALVNDIPAR